MDDAKIIDLFWARNEDAIKQTNRKYRRMLYGIADSVLNDPRDCEEVLNDTYLRVWNTIPPERPECYPAYLSKITRRLSIDVYRKHTAEKRIGSNYAVSIDELYECVSNGTTPESEIETELLAKHISSFLRALPERERNIFVQRYYYGDKLLDIAREQLISESNVKAILFRTRKKLKEYLSEEGLQ